MLSKFSQQARSHPSSARKDSSFVSPDFQAQMKDDVEALMFRLEDVLEAVEENRKDMLLGFSNVEQVVEKLHYEIQADFGKPLPLDAIEAPKAPSGRSRILYWHLYVKNKHTGQSLATLVALVTEVIDNPFRYSLPLNFAVKISVVHAQTPAEADKFGPLTHAIRVQLPQTVDRKHFCETMKKALKHVKVQSPASYSTQKA